MKHYLKTTSLPAFSIGLLLMPAAYAEEIGQPILPEQQSIEQKQPDFNKTEFLLGIAAGYADSGYHDKSADWTAAPLIQLETKRFYIRGLSAGVKLYTSANQSQELLLGATYLRDYGLKPSDSNNVHLQQLNRRKNGVMADISYNLYTPYGNLETQVSHDISGTNKGITAQAQYSYFWSPKPQLLIKPIIGIAYYNRRFNQYYYGISIDESLRNGLAAYRPRASVNPYVGLETQYNLTPKLSGFVGILIEALPPTVKNSPMNDGKYRIEDTVGMMYHF